MGEFLAASNMPTATINTGIHDASVARPVFGDGAKLRLSGPLGLLYVLASVPAKESHLVPDRGHGPNVSLARVASILDSECDSELPVRRFMLPRLTFVVLAISAFRVMGWFSLPMKVHGPDPTPPTPGGCYPGIILASKLNFNLLTS